MMTEPAPDRKLAILDAACTVIAGSGAARMRVADVAREAGVSTALVHYYFPSRAALIEQAFARADDVADEVAEAAVGSTATGREKVERLLATWAGDDPAIRANWSVWNEMWQYAAHSEGARSRVAASHRRWIDQIAELVAAGVEDGSVSAAADVAMTARRLAACADEWGREAMLGLRSRRGYRRDLASLIDHELGPRAGARGRAA
jgi:AcrR family transcriptional regulator